MDLEEGDAREGQGDLEGEAAVLDGDLAVGLEELEALAVFDRLELAFGGVLRSTGGLPGGVAVAVIVVDAPVSNPDTV